MTFLFYRHGSICEPALIKTFRNLSIDVIEETSEITGNDMPY